MTKGLFPQLCRLMAWVSIPFVLFACSSQPVVIHHYLLNQASVEPRQTHPLHDSAPLVIIDNVVLPEYLRSRSLVMQQNDGTLAVATKHVWAQPLPADIGQLLANSLADKGGYPVVYKHSAISTRTQENLHLTLYIEHFLPVSSGDVVLSGYWYTRHAGNGQSQPEPFHYTKALELDGYTHSVAQMRQLVLLLADDIAQKMASTVSTSEK